MSPTAEVIVVAGLAALVVHRAFAYWCVRRAFAVRRWIVCPARGERAQVIFVHERSDGACVGVVGCSSWEARGRAGCDEACAENRRPPASRLR